MKITWVSLCETCKFHKKGMRYNLVCSGGYFVESCTEYSYDRLAVDGVQLSLFECVR